LKKQHKSVEEDDSYNPILQKAYLTIVENQLKENNPPETNETLIRLIRAGHAESEAKKMIASVIATESFYILKEQREFDLAKFIAGLNQLK